MFLFELSVSPNLPLQMNGNRNQYCWFLQKKKKRRPENKSSQLSLDSHQYTHKRIVGYEKVCGGKGFISPGGLENAKVHGVTRGLATSVRWRRGIPRSWGQTMAQKR